MRSLFLSAAAACLAVMSSGADASTSGPEPSGVRTFTLSGGRWAHGPKETELRVTFADKAGSPSSIVWTGLGAQQGSWCVIEGGAYLRGSIRADRGGALSLRLIDRNELATDVTFEQGRLNFVLRGRLVAAYVLSSAASSGARCVSAPHKGAGARD